MIHRRESAGKKKKGRKGRADIKEEVGGSDTRMEIMRECRKCVKK